jgi:hypothetical protein
VCASGPAIARGKHGVAGDAVFSGTEHSAIEHTYQQNENRQSHTDLF